MQNQIKLTIIALALFSWACSTKNTVVIDGEIIGNEISRVEYAIPINGALSPFMTDTLKTDSLGNFHLEIPFQNPGFIVLRPFYKNRPALRKGAILLAEPGENYQVLIDPSNEENNFKVEGKYAKAINEYNKLPEDVLFSIPSKLLLEFSEDSVASSLLNKITNAREKEISIFIYRQD